MAEQKQNPDLETQIAEAADLVIAERTPKTKEAEKPKNPEQQAEIEAIKAKHETEKAKIETVARSRRERVMLASENESAEFQTTVDQFLKKPQSEILLLTTGKSNNDLKQGTDAKISFGGNSEIQRAVGLAMMLPTEIREISLNGVMGTREGLNGNFYDSAGNYIKVMDGDTLRIEKIASADEAKKLRQQKAESLSSLNKNTKAEGVSSNEKSFLIETATDFGIDPALMLAIREANNGNYGHDTGSESVAQIKVAGKYLQTAKHKFELANTVSDKDSAGNYTDEFINYLLNHYTLFGVESTKNQSEIDATIASYRRRKGLPTMARTEQADFASDATERVRPKAARVTLLRPREYSANPEALKGPDTTAGLKGKALLDNPQFRNRLIEIAGKIGCPVQALVRIMEMESGLDPAIVNKFGGATGLIQFMPKTAPALGTSTEALRKMSGLQQLTYVEKFYKPYFGKINNYPDLYLSTFYPLALKKDMDFVFGLERSPERAKKIVEQNKGIAKYSRRPDGLIDKRAFYSYAENHNRSNKALYARFDTLYSDSKAA